MATRALNVWMNGDLVGQWTVRRGDHRFNYSQSWLSSERRRPLSLTIPLTPTGGPHFTEVVEPYFENLLPDTDELRRRMMGRFGAGSTRAFDLLEQAGRDCVGAIQLLAPDSPPPRPEVIQGHSLDDAQIAALLRRIRSPGGGAQDEEDFRISLAGAQEKTALLRHQDRWWIPHGATPTTHILKLPILSADPEAPDLSTSVENEWLCAAILRALGFSVANCEIADFEEQRVLIVRRFDRAVSGERILRLPQEDLCQATGTSPALKYENRGGPGIATILDLLRGAIDPAKDREDFFRTQFAFWLLCATDGHAKNFSVFLEREGRFRLTPRYDVVSAYPVLGHGRKLLARQKITMAMAVDGKNRHYRWDEIHVDHWLHTARTCGLPNARELLSDLVGRVPAALAAVRSQLPQGFPAGVSDPILDGVARATERASAQLGAKTSG